MRMVDEKLLEILVCPENRTPLATADEELVAKLNRSIGAGKVKNRLGQTVETELEEGLVREDRLLLYPVVDGIPVMLVDEAIPLEQIQ
jgi:uncharacterized protein YbaR (Trm112 family)